MSAPDVNTWYRVSNQANATNALKEGGLNNGSSAVFMTAFEDDDFGQQWQFYPSLTISGELYYLRPRGLGPDWVLDV